MGSFGAVALAASNIVNQLAYIVYQVNIGLSQGSSILVSRAIGKGQGHEVAEIATATTLLWFSIAHQYLKGSQNVCVGLLRGLGNTRAGLTNTLIGYWLIGIPAMALCAYPLSLGGYGVWFGLCLGFGAASLLLWRRFLLDLRPLTGAAPLVAAPLVSKEAR